MINLLPPQEKKEIEREESLKIILILGIVVTIFVLSLFMIFFAIQIYIFEQLESEKKIVQIEKERLYDPEIKDIQKNVSLLNQNILKLDSFYQNQIKLIDILGKISQAIPPGTYLTNLSWKRDSLELNINGFAPLREDLFKLKENLEKESSFSEIIFPPANWVKPKEIDFQIRLKTKTLEK